MFVSRLALPSLVALAASVRTSDAVRPFRAIDVLNGEEAWEEEGREEEKDDVILGIVDDVSAGFFEQPLDHSSSDSGGEGGGGPTFRQRYFYSSRYVREASSGSSVGSGIRGGGGGDGGADGADKKEEEARSTYAFLCVGGEGPSLTERVLVDSVHCTGDMIESARRLHEEKGADVHMFALEHRYYGKSYPDFSSIKEDGGDEDAADDNSSSPVTNEHLRYLSSRQALSDLFSFVDFATDDDRFGLSGKDAKWIVFEK